MASAIKAAGLLVGHMNAAMDKIGRFGVGFETISRQNRALHEDVLQLRSDIRQAGLEIISRGDALARRMGL